LFTLPAKTTFSITTVGATLLALTFGMALHADSCLTHVGPRALTAQTPATVFAALLALTIRLATGGLVAGLFPGATAAVHTTVFAALDACARRLFRARRTVEITLKLTGRDAENVPVLLATVGVFLANARLTTAAAATAARLSHTGVGQGQTLVGSLNALRSRRASAARKTERVGPALLVLTLGRITQPVLQAHLTGRAASTLTGTLGAAVNSFQAQRVAPLASIGKPATGVRSTLIGAAVVVSPRLPAAERELPGTVDAKQIPVFAPQHLPKLVAATFIGYATASARNTGLDRTFALRNFEGMNRNCNKKNKSDEKKANKSHSASLPVKSQTNRVVVYPHACARSR